MLYIAAQTKYLPIDMTDEPSWLIPALFCVLVVLVGLWLAYGKRKRNQTAAGSLVANIVIPREVFPSQIEQMVELIGLTSSVARIKEMEEFLTETPLEQRTSFTVSNVEVFGERLESYSFIISRRFVKDGETYVGGENGEICNVTEYLNLIRKELEPLQDKS